MLEGALRHLHRPALDPALGRSLRGRRGLLEDVRQRAARAKSIEVPKLTEPRRVSWPTLIMIIGTRFYQQQGYDATVALSSGAIMATAS